ncbi:MAG: hypothetical protein A2075_03905 [Geobacteraceae bacterium GWC2_58_44]|nr:MAG: hypothetical protein A2075_03905 [Geobacteraceae bacterium GWC2_58_44]
MEMQGRNMDRLRSSAILNDQVLCARRADMLVAAVLLRSWGVHGSITIFCVEIASPSPCCFAFSRLRLTE